MDQGAEWSLLGTYKLFDMFWEHNICGEWWEMNLESWAGHKL